MSPKASEISPEAQEKIARGAKSNMIFEMSGGLRPSRKKKILDAIVSSSVLLASFGASGHI